MESEENIEDIGRESKHDWHERVEYVGKQGEDDKNNRIEEANFGWLEHIDGRVEPIL